MTLSTPVLSPAPAPAPASGSATTPAPNPAGATSRTPLRGGPSQLRIQELRTGAGVAVAASGAGTGVVDTSQDRPYPGVTNPQLASRGQRRGGKIGDSTVVTINPYRQTTGATRPRYSLATRLATRSWMFLSHAISTVLGYDTVWVLLATLAWYVTNLAALRFSSETALVRDEEIGIYVLAISCLTDATMGYSALLRLIGFGTEDVVYAQHLGDSPFQGPDGWEHAHFHGPCYEPRPYGILTGHFVPNATGNITEIISEGFISLQRLLEETGDDDIVYGLNTTDAAKQIIEEYSPLFHTLDRQTSRYIIRHILSLFFVAPIFFFVFRKASQQGGLQIINDLIKQGLQLLGRGSVAVIGTFASFINALPCMPFHIKYKMLTHLINPTLEMELLPDYSPKNPLAAWELLREVDPLAYTTLRRALATLQDQALKGELGGEDELLHLLFGDIPERAWVYTQSREKNARPFFTGMMNKLKLPQDDLVVLEGRDIDYATKCLQKILAYFKTYIMPQLYQEGGKELARLILAHVVPTKKNPRDYLKQHFKVLISIMKESRSNFQAFVFLKKIEGSFLGNPFLYLRYALWTCSRGRIGLSQIDRLLLSFREISFEGLPSPEGGADVNTRKVCESKLVQLYGLSKRSPLFALSPTTRVFRNQAHRATTYGATASQDAVEAAARTPARDEERQDADSPQTVDSGVNTTRVAHLATWQMRDQMSRLGFSLDRRRVAFGLTHTTPDRNRRESDEDKAVDLTDVETIHGDQAATRRPKAQALQADPPQHYTPPHTISSPGSRTQPFAAPQSMVRGAAPTSSLSR